MDRRELAELRAELKNHMVNNPTFAADFKRFIEAEKEACVRQYDINSAWEDQCRTQGRRKALEAVLQALGLSEAKKHIDVNSIRE